MAFYDNDPKFFMPQATKRHGAMIFATCGGPRGVIDIFIQNEWDNKPILFIPCLGLFQEGKVTLRESLKYEMHLELKKEFEEVYKS